VLWVGKGEECGPCRQNGEEKGMKGGSGKKKLKVTRKEPCLSSDEPSMCLPGKKQEPNKVGYKGVGKSVKSSGKKQTKGRKFKRLGRAPGRVGVLALQLSGKNNGYSCTTRPRGKDTAAFMG